MLFALILFVLLLITWGAARKQLRLEEVPTGWALLGIAVLSLVPVILVVLDGWASSGGSFEVAGVKIALNAATASQRPVVIPRNITEQPGLPVVDSGGSHILSTLRRSAGTTVVIVDLEDGHAWWETRLLVLCAGAQRLGRPSVIVFTAVQGGKAGHYLGWGRPKELLEGLLASDQRYRAAYLQMNSLAAAAHLNRAGDPNAPAPVALVIPQSKSWIISRQVDDPSPVLEEELLAEALRPMETPPREIDGMRLQCLFRAVLHTASVDRSVPDAEWVRAALLSDDDYIALTESGRYVGMMSSSTVVRHTLLSLIQS
ncbi:hypothetical protein [Kitasatospora sp. NPDC058190]|uniref:hypothetical protein n=1 Tax=Kitasatospora sp. NPDC058190 TaxID=3346371 RepID=UPI0036DB45F4